MISKILDRRQININLLINEIIYSIKIRTKEFVTKHLKKMQHLFHHCFPLDLSSHVIKEERQFKNPSREGL